MRPNSHTQSMPNALWKISAKTAISALFYLLFGAGLGYGGATLLPKPLVLSQDAAITGQRLQDTKVTLYPDHIDIMPTKANGTLFIFYSGGLVRPQAYEWLGRALAVHGIRTIIPIFPLDLAVFDAQKGQKWLNLPNYLRVFVGGHSLGGVMAAQLAKTHASDVQGLVFFGSYSSDDLTKMSWPVLSIAAEHDGLSTAAKIAAARHLLPSNSRFVEIKGSVHSFFGRYGPQQGDGTPTVSRDVAEKAIVATLLPFLK